MNKASPGARQEHHEIGGKVGDLPAGLPCGMRRVVTNAHTLKTRVFLCVRLRVSTKAAMCREQSNKVNQTSGLFRRIRRTDASIVFEVAKCMSSVSFDAQVQKRPNFLIWAKHGKSKRVKALPIAKYWC